MTADEVYELIRREKVIVIVRGAGSGDIVDIANALYAGGVKLMEITCNTKGVAEMISKLSVEMRGRMVIGAGTVITTELCREVLEAGAEYVVAPDVNTEVVEYCVARDVAVLPGAATATEILTAARCGAKMVKIFPAAAIGVDYIKQLRGPIDDVEFVAVGGVRPSNINDFVSAGCVAIGIGGSVVRKEFVENKDWAAISEAVREYVVKLTDWSV